MNYLSQILFFFGAIGAFNSLLVSIYILLNRLYSKLEHRIFGLFMLVLSLRILKGVFYSFSTEDPIWFLQTGPSFFLLIGPLLFSYFLCLIAPSSFWVKQWKYHLFFWIVIVVITMIWMPFTDHNEFHKSVLLPIINSHWLAYIFLCGFFVISNYKKTLKMNWLIILLISVLIVWMLFFFIPFDFFVTGSIVFSSIFYTCFIFMILNKKVANEIFQKVKIRTKSEHSEKSKVEVKRILSLMIDEKPYLQPNLKLLDIAETLDTPAHQLSKLINENFGKSFTDFINEYRIDEAKELLQENSLFTIEAIGNHCGFKSKSAFYKAFRKSTNMTPSKFLLKK